MVDLTCLQTSVGEDRADRSPGASVGVVAAYLLEREVVASADLIA